MTHYQNDTFPIISLRETEFILVQELAELETSDGDNIVIPVIHRVFDQSRGPGIVRPATIPFCYIVLTGDERHDISKIYEKICIRYGQRCRAGEFQMEYRTQITTREQSKTFNEHLLIRRIIRDRIPTARRSYRVNAGKC